MADAARMASGTFNGRWTDEEHRLFVRGLGDIRCGRDWRKLAANYVSHAV